MAGSRAPLLCPCRCASCDHLWRGFRTAPATQHRSHQAAECVAGRAGHVLALYELLQLAVRLSHCGLPPTPIGVHSSQIRAACNDPSWGHYAAKQWLMSHFWVTAPVLITLAANTKPTVTDQSPVEALILPRTAHLGGGRPFDERSEAASFRSPRSGQKAPRAALFSSAFCSSSAAAFFAFALPRAAAFFRLCSSPAPWPCRPCLSPWLHLAFAFPTLAVDLGAPVPAFACR